MRVRTQLIKTLASWGALLVFMMLTRPDTLPVIPLIAPFVFLFMAFYTSWNLLSLLSARFATKTRTGRSRRYLGLAISLVAVLFVVLQSLGQLTLRDIVTVAAIILVGYLYLTRNVFTVSDK